MKVKCLKIYNEITKQYQDISPWVTINKEYIVLEMLVRPGKEVLYRLVGDNENEMPALYDARQFEIVSDKIPSNWIIKQFSSGNFILSPAAWQKPGFWEDCYDHNSSSLDTYKREAINIYKEENENTN